VVSTSSFAGDHRDFGKNHRMQQELRHDGHTGYVRIKLDEIWMNAVPVLTSCCIACLPCAIFR
jgi:hypothetical protein